MIALVLAGTDVPGCIRQQFAVGRNFSSGANAAQRVDPDDAAALARSYLRAWEAELAAIVAEERYSQKHLAGWVTNRKLVSDVLLVHAPRENAWLMFRDVLSVDGKEVRDRQMRFDELFAKADPDLVASARRIADEGARYNLGRITRNVNTPISPLIFLREEYAQSTRWKSVKTVSIDGERIWELEFEQTRAPFAIHTPEGRGQPASGRFWISPGSGRIVRAEMFARSDVFRPQTGNRVTRFSGSAKIVAHFGPAPNVQMWVPIRMEEQYGTAGGVNERVEGEAVYTNHRRFQTSARIVPQ